MFSIVDLPLVSLVGRGKEQITKHVTEYCVQGIKYLLCLSIFSVYCFTDTVIQVNCLPRLGNVREIHLC
jgi:hypothetical protein